MDRDTMNMIHKEALKVVPFLNGQKKYNALLDSSFYFSEYGWLVAKANSKTDKASLIRKEAVTFFNALDSKAFSVTHEAVADMDCMIRKDGAGRVVQAMVFATMFVASHIICYLELFGVSKDYQGRGLGKQAILQLSDCADSHMNRHGVRNVVGVYIVVQVSRELKPHGFYRKLGFINGTPYGFESWTNSSTDIMNLSVDGQPTKDEARFRLSDLISAKPVAVKGSRKQSGKSSSKKQMRDDDDDEEEKQSNHHDQKLAANTVNKSAINGIGATQKEQSEYDETQSEDDGSRSFITGITSKTKTGAYNKHCMMSNCNAKRISGINWGTHVKKVHKDSIGDQEGRDYIKCAGDGCNACSQGKYLLLLRPLTWVLLLGSSYLGPLTWGLLLGVTSYLGSPLTWGHLLLGVTSYLGSLLTWVTSHLWFSQLFVGSQGYDGKRQSYVCGQCKKSKRYDKFPKDSKEVCLVCLGGGKSQVGMIAPQLNKRNLKQLPTTSMQDRVIQPSDSVSQAGSRKRPYSQIQQSVDDRAAEFKEPSSKRNKLSHYVPTVSNDGGDDMPMQELHQQVQVHMVAYTDQAVINQLETLQNSKLANFECAQEVQKLCPMFTQDLILKYIASGKHEKLIESIITVLQRVSQLDDYAVVGLAVASMVLGNACWEGTIKMFSQMDSERRERVFVVFKIHLQKHFNDELAEWLLKYWRVTEQQQLEMLAPVKPSLSATEVLTLSLAVAVQDTQRFVKFASAFIETSTSSADMMLKSIITKPKQMKITFDQLGELTELIQQESNSPVIESIKETLAAAKICEWVNLIKEKQMGINLLDAASVQSFLDELIAIYGKTKQLDKDLTQCGDPMYEMLVHQAEKKPNNRQFALAQYCIGQLHTYARQLWVVPSGQGKSIISTFAAVIALLSEMFTKVHMVYENQYLLDIDKADFADVFMMLGYDESRIERHISLDFVCKDGELAIIDEADRPMFRDPSAFKLFAAEACCLCFTATPDDQDAKGIERKVVTSFEFQRFHYSLDGADGANVAEVSLEVDETVQCETLEEKAQFIKGRATQGPVHVYCDPPLTEQLITAGCSPLIVTEAVDYKVLRQLDQQSNGSYRVVVAQDQFAMRGLDYRSKSVKITQVLDKSFENKREAIQGFNRVGRFGDNCTRIKFNGVEIIDKEMSLAYTAKLFRFYAEMQKKKEHLVLKPVSVKKAKPATEKAAAITTIKSNMGQKRFNALLGPGQSQIQGYFKK